MVGHSNIDKRMLDITYINWKIRFISMDISRAMLPLERYSILTYCLWLLEAEVQAGETSDKKRVR